MYNSIKPGQTWLDTDGKKIEAHAGAIYFENDTYYWYGENKEFTDGIKPIWTWGIKCYSSKDLYNWTDLGYLVDPDPDNEDAAFYVNNRADRPHIIYNEKTKKYVMWVKFSGERACFAVLTSDTLVGKYCLIKMDFRPHGLKAGDFDLVKDEETKKAYIYFDGDHTGINCIELTDDYLDVTDVKTLHFDGLYPPFVREAPAHLFHNNKHYLLTSGLTGYLPNPSEAAVADNYHGPFTVMGDPHVNDESSASFNSQISFIFKHPKKDLFIALADRWVSEYPMTKEKYEILKRAIASRFDPDKYSATMEERMSIKDMPMLASANTSKAEYVWLPIEWKDDMPIIRWYNEWKIEDFE